MKLVSGETHEKVTRRRALAVFVSSTTVASAAVLAACGASPSSSSASSASASSTVAKASSLSSPSSTSASSTVAVTKAGNVNQFVTANPTAAAQAAQAFIKKGPQSNQKAVEYWHMWSGQWEMVVDRIVAWYNTTHPGYFVKPLVISGDANAKFLSAVAGGTPPDIMTQWNQVIPTWADQGVLQPLDQLVTPADASAFKKWFWPVAWSIGNYKGHQWAAPSTMNSWALMYNKQMFQEVGLDPNKPPTSIEELDTYAAKLFKMQSNGQIDVAGFIPSSIWQWGDVFGGDFYDESSGKITITNPKIVDALTWEATYSKRYGVQKIASFQNTISSTIKGVSPMAYGKYAMAVQGQWVNLDMKHYGPKIEYGAVPQPYPPGGRPNASWVNGNYQIIPKGAKQSEGAFSFLEFWSGFHSPEQLATICTWGGWIPCGPAMTKEKPYLDYLKEYPNFAPYVEIFSSPNVRITPKIDEQAYMWDQVNAAESYATQLQKTAEAALAGAQQLVEARIAADQKQK
ncbi:MAG: ABC transporter substrate-binding protein [Chloroflexi bacterium]|nr:ABC transporter substrate-binding protein [Chloroflexota bacterium]